MLPPFHGERMRAYEAADRARSRRPRSTRWPRGERVRAAPADARDHVRGDPARRLRRHRPRRASSGCASCCRGCSTAPPRRSLSFRVLLARRLGPPRPARAASRRSTREIDELLLADIAARRAAPPAASRRRRPLAAARGALRGRQRDERPRAARPARDAAARRPRDDRDRARVDVRPAAARARGARAADAPSCATGGDALPARGRSPSRCGCGRSCRSPGGGSRTELRAGRLHAARRAPTSRPRSGSRTRAPTSIREPYAFRPERFLDARAGDLRVDPVRRRRPALPRRGVRRARDAGRARDGARAGCDLDGRSARAEARRAAQHHLRAAPRDAGPRGAGSSRRA